MSILWKPWMRPLSSGRAGDRRGRPLRTRSADAGYVRPDGYAVRSEDIRGAGPGSPVTLHILGTNRAGCLPRRRLRPGAAIRVMTGSPLPAGADCVVPFEKTDEPADKNGPNPSLPTQVRVFQAEEPGANVRPAGSNVTKGSLVLPRGVCVGPAQIAALGAIGRATIKVIRRPRWRSSPLGTSSPGLGPR